jgi:DNA topoisomerase-1
MSDAKIDRTIVKIGLSNSEEQLTAKGEIITFEGFMKVYLEGKDDEGNNEKGILPPLTVGDKIDLLEGLASEQFSRYPARYTEASLVKKMEELGIGRPSTYAATITTVQKRGYVEKDTRDGKERISKTFELKNGDLIEKDVTTIFGAEKNKLFPTDVGIVVTDFLIENFNDIMQYSFTASVEDEFDQIAEGKKIWNEMIAAFYSKFHNQVELVSETKGKSLGQRSLGVDQKSGKTLYARIGPFGPMIQLGEKSENENDPKPKYASLLKGQTIQTISFEEAMKLFDLPRNVGEYKGEEIVAAIGRFGPYLRYNGKFTSIKKTDNEDPLTIKLDRAIELIEIKIQADKDRIVSNFDGSPLVQVLNGRYGVFIQISPEKGKKINVKIPKDKDPKTLSRQDCLDLMENQTKK